MNKKNVGCAVALPWICLEEEVQILASLCLVEKVVLLYRRVASFWRNLPIFQFFQLKNEWYVLRNLFLLSL